MNTTLIYCAILRRELEAVGKEKAEGDSLPGELHLRPDFLKEELQKAIDCRSGSNFIVLCFGLCGMAAVGLHSTDSRLVIPKVDDCIQLLLGSRERFAAINAEEPGTYYLTRGFIGEEVDPLSQLERTVHKHGWDKSLNLMKRALFGYKRFALIDTGHPEAEEDWAYTEKCAHVFGMKPVRIQGSLELVSKMIRGGWDSDFLVLDEGEPITREMFGY